MTIEQAVKKYNSVMDEIHDISDLCNKIITRQDSYMKNPLGYYEVGEDELSKIYKYLDIYKSILKMQLQEEFNPEEPIDD